MDQSQGVEHSFRKFEGTQTFNFKPSKDNRALMIKLFVNINQKFPARLRKLKQLCK